ncbi:hypothetical protein O4J56_17805 [Nocardiopsis sp. RSe5-2]|uniref:Type IV secretion system protein n=1 Tax=Nocardiopsis endophytica TaxID=3018445 RepID=A0ABT4U6D0_9ACTN|nr:hypothetical protein [Nocardiopsis endophytica]MDA2812503.1 hypothetical protein [Nocardiopsis endophytica]
MDEEENASECSWYQFGCSTKESVEELIGSAAGQALDTLYKAVAEGVSFTVKAMTTGWMGLSSGNSIGGSSGNPERYPAEMPPSEAQAGDGLVTLLGYVSWIALAVIVGSLIIAGAMIALRARRGEGGEYLGRVTIILVSAVIVGASSKIAEVLLGSGPIVDGGDAVVTIQQRLYYFVAAAVVLSLIIGAAKMAWEQRAEPGKDLLRSLLTLVVVSGAGLTALSILLTIADGFSNWMVNSDNNDVEFGDRVLSMLGLASVVGTPAFGVIIAITLGSLAMITGMLQMVLLIVRDGLLVVMAGAWPLVAAVTNTETGREAFKRYCGWMLALVLYKPAAAIVYATAFLLVGDTSGDGALEQMMNIIVGLSLMIAALLVLPALIKLVAPAASLGGGSGGGAALVAGAAAAGGQMATGAVERSAQSGNSGGPPPPSSGPGADPSGAGHAPSGAAGGEQQGQPQPEGSQEQQDGTGAGPQNPVPGGADPQAAMPGGGAAGGAGVAEGAAGAGAAGATPVGAAAQAGQQAVQTAYDVAQGTAQEAAEGPNGSN